MRKALVYFILVLWMMLSFTPLVNSQELSAAQPRGGDWLASQFIDEEMVYPEQALKKSLEGSVNFDFEVSARGVVSNIKINSSADPILQQEAKRLFGLLIWEPAVYRGKEVDSKAQFNIGFSLKHYKRACRERGYQSISIPDIPIDSSGTVYLYRITDQPPAPLFSSEDITFQSFIAENFEYPEEALRKNISGVVKLNFIVEPHGRISNLMVSQRLGAGCTEEAIRLIKLIQWKPGMKNGKAVRVNVTVPITFGLSADGNYKVAPAAGGTTFQ